VELNHLGWNALTIGFIGTLIFSFAEGWGVWQQNKAIWKNKSGESVSVIWFTYFTALFGIVFIYGLSTKSIALAFNGFLLTPLYIPLVVGLWKFKGFTKVEKICSACFLAAVIACVLVPYKDWFFLIFTVGNIFFSFTQPYEIWKNKSSGVVEIKLLVVFLASTIFWVTYAYASHDWVLEIITPCYLVIISLTTILWFKYRKH